MVEIGESMKDQLIAEKRTEEDCGIINKEKQENNRCECLNAFTPTRKIAFPSKMQV